MSFNKTQEALKMAIKWVEEWKGIAPSKIELLRVLREALEQPAMTYEQGFAHGYEAHRVEQENDKQESIVSLWDALTDEKPEQEPVAYDKLTNDEKASIKRQINNAFNEGFEKGKAITEGSQLSNLKVSSKSEKPLPPPAPIHTCTYSRTMNQEYPRKCTHCGEVEAKTQPAQEPVAYELWQYGRPYQLVKRADVVDEMAYKARLDGAENVEVKALYTHPALQPTQEPVAWLWLEHGKPRNAFIHEPMQYNDDGYWTKKGFSYKPLYTHPAPVNCCNCKKNV